MNAQAINYNKYLQPAQTQASDSVSNAFGADDKFSKTFEEIKSKIDNKNNTSPPAQTSVQPQNNKKADNAPQNASADNTDTNKDTKQAVSETPDSNETTHSEDAVSTDIDNTSENTTSVTDNAQSELLQEELDALAEEAALNALNTTSSDDSEVLPLQTTTITDDSADAEEQRALANQKRINNLKTSNTATIAAAALDADDTTTVKSSVIPAVTADTGDTEDGVLVKASEKVAQAAKDGTAAQTQELSSQAKQTAMENLQAIHGTDTTIVESKSSTSSDSQSDSGSSFSQGNAAEQIIKMSIENADADSVLPAQNYSSHADKAVQAVNNVQKTPELNKSDIMNQIGTKMQDLPESGSSKVTIILKPEHLGRIQLEIVNTGNGITARMLTENQQVKELLDKNMETLKSQLGAQGVNVNNIKVENTQQTAHNSMNFEREQFSQDFSHSSQNHNASNADSTKAYDENGLEFADDLGEIEHEIAKSQILHDGKIDYKV